jgi:hypothetical protein
VLNTINRGPSFSRRFILEAVVLRECDDLQLEALLSHPCLVKSVVLYRCGHLESLEHILKAAPALQSLQVRGCRSLYDAGVLPLLSKLHALSISDCVSISFRSEDAAASAMRGSCLC